MFEETKKYLKETALEIRSNKNKRKLKYRGNLDLWDIESKIQVSKYHYRHHHIALCELRGRIREEIERPAENNLPNEKYIDQIKEQLIKEYNDKKIVCACA